MLNYDNSNINLPSQNMIGQQQQAPIQFPYGNNNMSFNNGASPYNNYMGRINNFQNVLPNQYLKCRPVSSKDEARAYQIDLDGSLWVFTDVGNGKIYTKQINNDGTAAFKTYVFTEDENPYNSTEYVTKEEFNKVVQALMAAIPTTTQENASVSTKNNPQNQGKIEMMNF